MSNGPLTSTDATTGAVRGGHERKAHRMLVRERYHIRQYIASWSDAVATALNSRASSPYVCHGVHLDPGTACILVLHVALSSPSLNPNHNP